MSTDAPSIGSIRLHDSIRSLPAGGYRLRTSLEVLATDGQNPSTLPAPGGEETLFEVVASRFSIAPDEIQSRHPPRSARGDFSEALPHAVLGRRTLPWERRIDSSDEAPWLALLVFRLDELETAPGGGPLVTDKRSVLFPELSDPEDPQVSAIRVKSAATLASVLPRREELALLTHVRQVNLADTELAGADDDGWFAVVASNRAPRSGPGPGGTEYIACLVSLEGRGDLWTRPSGQKPPPLLVLSDWRFTCLPDAGTFQHLVAGLDAAAFGAPSRRPADLLAPDGTLSLVRTDHQGISSVASYRGPLRGWGNRTTPPTDSDISREAAWELGRLMGSADGRFLRELALWHSKDETRARAASHRKALERSLPPVPGHAAKVGRIDSSTELRRRLTDLVAFGDLRRVDPWSVAKRRIEPAAEVHRPAPSDTSRADRLAPGAKLLAERHQALAPLLRQGSAESWSQAGAGSGVDAAGISSYIHDTLAGYRLLDGIPFRYLVPDSRLLPPESMRFFTVDEAWIDDLATGALETSLPGTREQARIRAALPAALVASRSRVSFQRDLKRGRMLGAAGSPPDTISGFLLNSAAVSGWPGLQIRAWTESVPTSADPNDPALASRKVGVLRLERLSPSVLLVLFAGVPAMLWLEEPHHGVQFGYQTIGGAARVARRGPDGRTDPSDTVDVVFRPGGEVVDVATLAGALGATGSGAFARQILRAPVRQRFATRPAAPKGPRP